MDKRNMATLFIVLVIVAAIFVYGWQKGFWLGTEQQQVSQIIYQTPQTPASNQATAQQAVQTAAQQIERIPVETLKASAKDKYTMASPSVSDLLIKFYTPGADVTDPYVLPLDTINVSTGSGSTSNYIIQTGTSYDVYLDGGSTYYDEKLRPTINYNKETGKGYLLIDSLSYVPLSPVGAFVDVDSLPEVQDSGTVVIDSGTDEITYNETNGAGSFWIRVDIGNANANSDLKDVVMCFRDVSANMEGDEITSITASFVSGSTKISIPGSLTAYFNDAAGSGAASCFTIATSLGSAERARWEFKFTVDESKWDSGENLAIDFDDLGDYKAKQYPSRDTKASTETLTIKTAT